jgi:hypothetical protein
MTDRTLGFNRRHFPASAAAATGSFALSATPSRATDPIRIGFGMSLSGGLAPGGRQCLLAMEIWKDEVNGKGGLIGRPVELVSYDDQSNPSNVPGLYAKLIDVDKVDLLVSPFATNQIAPAMPVARADAPASMNTAMRLSLISDMVPPPASGSLPRSGPPRTSVSRRRGSS